MQELIGTKPRECILLDAGSVACMTLYIVIADLRSPLSWNPETTPPLQDHGFRGRVGRRRGSVNNLHNLHNLNNLHNLHNLHNLKIKLFINMRFVKIPIIILDLKLFGNIIPI